MFAAIRYLTRQDYLGRHLGRRRLAGLGQEYGSKTSQRRPATERDSGREREGERTRDGRDRDWRRLGDREREEEEGWRGEGERGCGNGGRSKQKQASSSSRWEASSSLLSSVAPLRAEETQCTVRIAGCVSTP